MRRIRRGSVWLFMLWKRMLKKPGYTILLLAIVLMAGGLALFAGSSNDLVRVAIYAENEKTRSVFEASEEKGAVIKYEYFDTEEQALNAVKHRGFDAAWLLEGDIEDISRDYVRRGKAMVRVFQREDTVFLRLARERLFATVYPYISKAVYDEFIEDNFNSPDKNVTDEYYYSQSESRPIIDIKFNNSEQEISDLSLLASPVRGLLAIAVFICAYAALMNFKKDRISGLFARTPENRLVLIEIAYIIVSVFNAAVLTLISMKITGIFTTLGAELLLMTVYILICTAFCVVLGEMVDSIGALGAVMPVLTLLMLVICPVFINLVDLPQLQLLMPPYYYLSAMRNTSYILYALIYIVISAVIYAALRCVKCVFLKIKYK